LFIKGTKMSKKIKVLITYKGLTKRHIRQIQGVSERIEVEQATDKRNVLDAVRDAEVIFGHFNKEMLFASKKLRWVQVGSAGVENYLFTELVNSQVLLTTTSGIHRTPVSEIVIAMMLAFCKRLDKFMRSQLEAKWEKLVPDELAGKTLGLLGLGNIGMETAWKAKCLGMKVLALDKTPIRAPKYVDEVLGPEDLDHLLHKSDYFVITVPLTKETYHMIGEEELKLMKPDAYIINVARGAVIDNKALIKALKEKWITGAGLDVFEEEPLPKDSEFWKLENVILTPHVSGSTPHYTDRAVKIFCENLRRYLEGKPLINTVDKKAGY
jgi:D-2-hydroxyacid dehydrogenase (NADP+)